MPPCAFASWHLGVKKDLRQSPDAGAGVDEQTGIAQSLKAAGNATANVAISGDWKINRPKIF